MNYCNIVTQEGPVASLPSRLSAQGLDIHQPDFAMCASQGWRKLDALPTPPDGQQLTATEFSQDGSRPDYARPVYTYDVIPLPIPERFPNGIDASVLVLDTPSGKGAGYVSSEDGDMVRVVYAHESPYDMVALAAKRQAALAAHEQAKAAKRAAMDKAKTDSDNAKENAGKANNVAALRAQVAELARIVAALVEASK